MKKYTLLLFFLFTLNSFAQVDKYRGISVVEVENTGIGDKYSESKKADVIIVFELTNRKITVSENGEKVFNIIKSRSYFDNENNERTRFNCKNEKGEKISIEIIKYAKPKNEVETQIVIKNLTLAYIYNVNKIQN